MKTILITGASGGIGKATALKAGKKGYAVCVHYNKNKQAAEEIAAQIKADGGKAIIAAADLSEEAEIVELFKIIDRELGRITALVNNAGILEQQTKVVNLTAERLQRIFATNVTGPFICAREAVKRMSTGSGGNGGGIVNISSIGAVHGSPGEYVDYAASKAAIDTFTLGLAKEVAQEGIRVNAIRPGVIYTNIHALGGEPDRVNRVKEAVPMKRGGYPEEIADSILWLLSEEASYVTGSILNVAGGR